MLKLNVIFGQLHFYLTGFKFATVLAKIIRGLNFSTYSEESVVVVVVVVVVEFASLQVSRLCSKL